MNLLHLSDFTKSSYQRHSHRGRKLPQKQNRRLNECNYLQRNQEEEEGGGGGGGGDTEPVRSTRFKILIRHVYILKQLPSSTSSSSSTNKKIRKNETYETYNDEYATIYTHQMQLLHQLQIFDGGICFLSSSSSSSSCNVSSVPVIVRLLSSSSISSSSISSSSISSSSHCEKDNKSFEIYIPPTIATSIGIHSNCKSHNENIFHLSSFPNNDIIHDQRNDYDPSNTTTTTTTSTTIHNHHHFHHHHHHASKAKIIEVAIPPFDYTISFEKLMLFQQQIQKKHTNHDASNQSTTTTAIMEEQMKNVQDDALKKHFLLTNHKKNTNGGEDCDKEKCRLVSKGSIIAILSKNPIVLQHTCHDCNNCNNNDDDEIIDYKDEREILRYYKVVYLEGNTRMEHSDDDNQQTSSMISARITNPRQNGNHSKNNEHRYYWLSPKTELTLAVQQNSGNTTTTTTTTSRSNISNESSQSYDYPIHRIPNSFLMKSFISSVKKKNNNDNDRKQKHYQIQNHKNHDKTTTDISIMDDDNNRQTIHTSLSQSSMSSKLAQCILSIWKHNRIQNQYGSMQVLTTQVLHVMGENRAEIKSCIDDTARKVGMNVLQIHGLSAFLFRQETYTTSSSSSSSSSSNHRNHNITGTIRDKLAGLKLGFEIARKSSPCLLHICLDGELIKYDNDEVSVDEENRLLSTMTEHLMESVKNVIFVDDLPPTFLILSTKSNLPPEGPIASRLLNDTFFIMEESTKVDVDGSSKHPKSKSSSLIPNIKWEDVGGLSHVREEIIDAIELPLKYPHLFGKSKRSGILLYGPPGTGKTLIAKAVATECGLPFLSVKGPELLGSYVGESEGNIRSIFQSAREAAIEGNGGAILFFDEIDSLAPRRGGLGDGGGVMERVVASFLGEMDKELIPANFDSYKNMEHEEKVPSLFVIGATNRPDLLDPSLLRPGRFDRLVYLGVSAKREDRISILASLTRKFTFENHASAHNMAESVIDHIPENLSGADFSAICNKALMFAVKRLCKQADDELYKSAENCSDEEKPTMDKVLSQWSQDQCTPRVSREDFINASRDIVPIIKGEDLKKYDALRQQFNR